MVVVGVEEVDAMVMSSSSSVLDVLRRTLHHRCDARCDVLCHEEAAASALPKELLASLRSLSSCISPQSPNSAHAYAIDEMLRWRRERLEDSRMSASVHHRRAQVIDRTFCQIVTAMLMVMREHGYGNSAGGAGENALMPTLASSLEAIAFHLLLQSQAASETQQQQQQQQQQQKGGTLTSPPYEWARIAGTTCAAKMLGVFASIPSRFEAVTRRFIAELSLRLNAESNASSSSSSPVVRADVLAFIRCMAYIDLTGAFTHALPSLTAFTIDAFPLRYTAHKKKSEVHHALCVSLTAMLRPMIMMTSGRRSMYASSSHVGTPDSSASNPGSTRMSSAVGYGGIVPLPSRSDVSTTAYWHQSLGKLRTELGFWLKSDYGKHSSCGYPLYVTALCLCDGEEMGKQWAPTCSVLRKMMRDRRLSSTAFDCLCLCVYTYTSRHFHEQHQTSSSTSLGALPADSKLRAAMAATTSDLLSDLVTYIKGLDSGTVQASGNNSSTATNMTDGRERPFRIFVSTCLVLSLVELKTLLVKVIAPLLTWNDSNTAFSESVLCGVDILYRILLQLSDTDGGRSTANDDYGDERELAAAYVRGFVDETYECCDDLDRTQRRHQFISEEARQTVESLLPSIRSTLALLGSLCHNQHGTQLDFSLTSGDQRRVQRLNASGTNNASDTVAASTAAGGSTDRGVPIATTSFRIFLILIKLSAVFSSSEGATQVAAAAVAAKGTSAAKRSSAVTGDTVILLDKLPAYLMSRHLILRDAARRCLSSLVRHRATFRRPSITHCCKMACVVCCDGSASVQNIHDLVDFIVFLLKTMDDAASSEYGNKGSLEYHEPTTKGDTDVNGGDANDDSECAAEGPLSDAQIVDLECLGILLLCHFDTSVKRKGVHVLNICRALIEASGGDDNGQPQWQRLPFILHLELGDRFVSADIAGPSGTYTFSHMSLAAQNGERARTWGEDIPDGDAIPPSEDFHHSSMFANDAIDAWCQSMNEACTTSSFQSASANESLSTVASASATIAKSFTSSMTTLSNYVDWTLTGANTGDEKPFDAKRTQYFHNLTAMWMSFGCVLFSSDQYDDILRRTLLFAKKAVASFLSTSKNTSQTSTESNAEQERLHRFILASIASLLSNVRPSFIAPVLREMATFMKECNNGSVTSIRSDSTIRVKNKQKHQLHLSNLVSQIRDDAHRFVASVVGKICCRLRSRRSLQYTQGAEPPELELMWFIEESLRLLEIKERADDAIDAGLRTRVRSSVCYVIRFVTEQRADRITTAASTANSMLNPSFRLAIFKDVRQWGREATSASERHIYDAALSSLLVGASVDEVGESLISSGGDAMQWLQCNFRLIDRSEHRRLESSRQALRHLLMLSPGAVFDVCIQRCFYDGSAAASEFFIAASDYFLKNFESVKWRGSPTRYDVVFTVLALFYCGNTAVPESRAQALRLLDALLQSDTAETRSHASPGGLRHRRKRSALRMSYATLALPCCPSTVREQQQSIAEEFASATDAHDSGILRAVSIEFIARMMTLSERGTRSRKAAENSGASLEEGNAPCVNVIDSLEVGLLAFIRRIDLAVGKGKKTAEKSSLLLLWHLFSLSRAQSQCCSLIGKKISTASDDFARGQSSSSSFNALHIDRLWCTLCGTHRRNVVRVIEWLLDSPWASVMSSEDDEVRVSNVLCNLDTAAEILVGLCRVEPTASIDALVAATTACKNQKSPQSDSRVLVSLACLAAIAQEHDEELRAHLPTLVHVCVTSLWNDSRDRGSNYDVQQRDGNDVTPPHSRLLGTYARKFLSALMCRLVERQLALCGHYSSRVSSPLVPHERTPTNADDSNTVGALCSRTVQDVIGMLAELGDEDCGDELESSDASSFTHAAVEHSSKASSDVGSSRYSRYRSLVSSLVACLEFTEGNFVERWSSVALSWSCASPCDAVAIQSLRVLRELNPGCEMSREGVHELIASLLDRNWELHDSDEQRGAEIIFTLKTIVETMSPRRLLLLPELFWICVSQIKSPCALVARVSCAIFSAFVARVDMGDEATGMLFAVAQAVDTGDEAYLSGATTAISSAVQLAMTECNVLDTLITALETEVTASAATKALLGLVSCPSWSLFGNPVRNAFIATVSLLPRLAAILTTEWDEEQEVDHASPVDVLGHEGGAVSSARRAAAVLARSCGRLGLRNLADELERVATGHEMDIHVIVHALVTTAEDIGDSFHQGRDDATYDEDIGNDNGALFVSDKITSSPEDVAQRSPVSSADNLPSRLLESSLLRLVVHAFASLRREGGRGGGSVETKRQRISIAIIYAVISTSPPRFSEMLCAGVNGALTFPRASTTGDAASIDAVASSSSSTEADTIDWLPVAQLTSSPNRLLAHDATTLLEAAMHKLLM